MFCFYFSSVASVFTGRSGITFGTLCARKAWRAWKTRQADLALCALLTCHAWQANVASVAFLAFDARLTRVSGKARAAWLAHLTGRTLFKENKSLKTKI